MNKIISFNINWDYQSYLRAQYDILFSNIFLKGIIYLIGILFTQMQYPSVSINQIILISFVLVLAWIIGIYFNTRIIWNSRVLLRENATYTLSEQEFTISTSSKTVTYNWNNFIKFNALNKYFVLTLPKREQIIIPISSLSDNALIQQFKDIASTKIVKKVELPRETLNPSKIFRTVFLWTVILIIGFILSQVFKN